MSVCLSLTPVHQGLQLPQEAIKHFLSNHIIQHPPCVLPQRFFAVAMICCSPIQFQNMKRKPSRVQIRTAAEWGRVSLKGGTVPIQNALHYLNSWIYCLEITQPGVSCHTAEKGMFLQWRQHQHPASILQRGAVACGSFHSQPSRYCPSSGMRSMSPRSPCNLRDQSLRLDVP